MSLDGYGDATRFLRHYNDHGVAVLRHTHRSTVAQTEFLGDVETMGYRQNTSRSLDALTRDNHGTIVQWGVLEEDVLDETLVDVGVDFVACVCYVVERCGALNNDKGTHFSFAHVHAGKNDGHNCLPACPTAAFFLFLLEESQQQSHPLVGTDVVEEFANVLLEQDDKTNHSHAHQLVHDRTKQAHFEYL